MPNANPPWGFRQELLATEDARDAVLIRSNSVSSEGAGPPPPDADVSNVFSRLAQAGRNSGRADSKGRQKSPGSPTIRAKSPSLAEGGTSSPTRPRSPRIAEALRRRKMRRASTETGCLMNTAAANALAAAAAAASMEKENGWDSTEPGLRPGVRDEKLHSLVTTMEKDLRSRLVKIDEKIDTLCNYAKEASTTASDPLSSAALTLQRRGSLSARDLRPHSGGMVRLLLERQTLHGSGRSSEKCHQRPGPLAAAAAEELRPRKKGLSMPSLRLPRRVDHWDDEPPLPAAVYDSEIPTPSGMPGWLESSHSTGRGLDEGETTPESKKAWTPDKYSVTRKPSKASVADAITKTLSLDKIHRRRDSWASSVSSGSVELLRAKVRAMSQKRSPSQQAVWRLMEEAESSSGAYAFSWFMDILVLANVCFCTLQTTDPPTFQGMFPVVLHFLFDICFMVEVITRFIVCPNRLTFFISGSNWIDMAAAVPLIMNIVQCATQDCEQSHIMDSAMVILPVLRLSKLLRSFEQFHLLLNAFSLAFEALPVLLYTLAMLVMFFAAVIFYAEPRTNIGTLPQSIWLVIVTMMTVGYGDTYPRSTSGLICTSILIICSALYMAIPLGIVGGAFSRVWEDRDRLMLIRRTRNRLRQWGYTPKDILELFYLYDHDKSGELDLGEFSEMINEMRLGIGTERIVNLFKTFDSDGSGKVDDEEFVRALYPKAYNSIYQFRALPEDTNHQAEAAANAATNVAAGSGPIKTIAETTDEGMNDKPVEDRDSDDNASESESC